MVRLFFALALALACVPVASAADCGCSKKSETRVTKTRKIRGVLLNIERKTVRKVTVQS